MKLHMHTGRKRKKGDTARLAALLAPLEELHKQAVVSQTPSAAARIPTAAAVFEEIIVDNANLQMPVDIMEGSDAKTFLGMEPVVLVILGVMLVFIAFIAWQISLMPVE